MKLWKLIDITDALLGVFFIGIILSEAFFIAYFKIEIVKYAEKAFIIVLAFIVIFGIKVVYDTRIINKIHEHTVYL